MAVFSKAALLIAACLALPAPALAQMVTGTYTGNGTDNRAITQLGFTPDIVIVKGNATQIGVFRTSTMSGDRSKDATGATALGANLVQSLDSASGGGFTVGNDTQVNGNGTAYYFAAFKAASGHITIGSYTGNGTSQSITGVGFSPALVVVMDGGANEAVFRTSASTSSCNFTNSACNTTTYVTALGADGFTVGSNARVNGNARTYYYVAWASADATVGTYTGNATDNRSISIGIQPEYVWVKASGQEAVHYPASLSGAGDSSLTFRATANGTNRIQALESNGFQVGTNARVNTSGTTYIYVAFVRSVPTAVRMSWATATRYAEGTYLQWRTGYESDNLGFHVYREAGSKRTRVTSGLIAGSGLLVRGSSGGNTGQSYQWWDTTPADRGSTVTYWIEDVDLNGTTTRYGPIRPVASGGTVPAGIPSRLLTRLLKNTATTRVPVTKPSPAAPGKTARAGAPIVPLTATAPVTPAAPVTSAAPLEISATPDAIVPFGGTVTQKASAAAVSTQNALASGKAVKVSVTGDGWYRVTQPQLVAAGYTATADSRTLQLFVDGIEQSLKLIHDNSGRLGADGALEFYGTGTDTPYTDTHVYWLRWGYALGKRVGWTDRATSSAPTVTSFPYTTEHKNRQTFFAALQNGEAENFFGEILTTDATDLTLNAAHLDAASPAAATLEVVLQGVTDLAAVPGGHHVGIQINGQDVGTIDFDGRAHVTRSFSIPSSVLVAGDNLLTLVSTGGDADVSLVDIVRLTYPRLYAADGDRLRLTAEGRQIVSVGGFSSAAVRIVDVTTAGVPFEVVGSVHPAAGGYAVTFTAPATGTRTLFAFADGSIWTPAAVAANQPSSWRKATTAASYVIVAPAAFLPAVRNLSTLRQASGLSVAVVDIEDVYDEFSFGEKTPYALRSFLARAKAAWQVAPRFVALVGNATTDPKNYLGMDEPDYVPTKMISTIALETASDDWFVDGDGDGIPEVAAIGRIPARSLGQATAMIAKIVAYEHADGGWTREVSLVADQRDEGDFDFAGTSQKLESLLPPEYAVTEIFRGEMGTASARADLLQRINAGQAIVNYSGHGSVQVWRDDLLTTDDVPALTNGARLPLFVMMNCLNGFFQGLFPEESLAEALVRADHGGAIAAWASSGFTEPEGQEQLSRAFYRLLFEGQYATIGEAAAAAKSFTGDRDVRQTWILFGDPAMRLAGMPAPSTVTLEPSATTAPSVPAGPSSPAAGPSARAGDFDGDGRDDTLRYLNGAWRVLLSGTGRVREGTWQNGLEAYPAHFNHDGLTDLFLFDRATGTWAVAINGGAATFTYTHGTWSTRWTVHVLDLNDDGLDDVLLVDAVTGAYVEALSDGTGGFAYYSGS